MKKIVVLALIVFFMVSAYFLSKRLREIIKPRQSLANLFLYFFIVLLLVFVLSFLMVLVITKLYPEELIK